MKKITYKMMNDFVKAHEHDTVSCDLDSENKIIVNAYLPFEETSGFVERVVSVCFSDNGEYLAENYDFIFKATILQTMSNLPIPVMKNDKNAVDVHALYRYVYALPYEFWTQVMDVGFIKILKDMTDKKIEYQIRKKLSFTGQVQELLQIMNGLQHLDPDNKDFWMSMAGETDGTADNQSEESNQREEEIAGSADGVRE